MTDSIFSPETHSPDLGSSPGPIPNVAALQPRLMILSDLLTRLLERMEAPPGEAAQQIGQLLVQISGLTGSLERTGEALCLIMGQDGPLGQLGADIRQIRERLDAQEHQMASIIVQTTTLVEWLGAPAADAA